MTLPDKPSALIRLALSDLAKCEADPKYIVDMCFWYAPYVSDCRVCLAGAVMAHSLADVTQKVIEKNGEQGDESQEIFPQDFNEQGKLAALNYFRVGSIEEGLRAMRIFSDPPFVSHDIVSYDIDPEQFRADMHLLADDLERAGL